VVLVRMSLNIQKMLRVNELYITAQPIMVFTRDCVSLIYPVGYAYSIRTQTHMHTHTYIQDRAGLIHQLATYICTQYSFRTFTNTYTHVYIQDRVGLIHQLATLPEHPESVPINRLVAIKVCVCVCV